MKNLFIFYRWGTGTQINGLTFQTKSVTANACSYSPTSYNTRRQEMINCSFLHFVLMWSSTHLKHKKSLSLPGLSSWMKEMSTFVHLSNLLFWKKDCSSTNICHSINLSNLETNEHRMNFCFLGYLSCH